MKPDSKPSPADDPVVLAVTGMTCAACAARIEKKLNKLDGVVATVNYATSKATITGLDERPDASRLMSVIESLGYGAVAPNIVDGESTVEIATEAHLLDVRRRLALATIGAVPVMALSMIGALQFDGWQWVSLVLAAPVATWCAWPFHKSAWRSAAHRTTTMDTLISLGVVAAMAWSVWALIFGNAGEIGMTMDMNLLPRTDEHHGAMVHDEIYLEVATTLVAFILAGRWFEVRARRRAGDSLRALSALGAKSVTLWRDGAEAVIPIGALGVGETFVVRPGETVATDGVVIDGVSAIDASMITGESLPVDCRRGDAVTGGTLNTNGRLLVRATRIGRDTVLAQMARLVERAQDGKAPVQRLADKVSAVFVPAVIALSSATLIGWLVVTGDARRSFEAAVAVLVIACPCALGLATPVALLVGTGRAAREGIIIKGAHALEASRAVDTIVFDKTGTLTTGVMTLQRVDELESGHLGAVLALESLSEHPVARAVVGGLRERGVQATIGVEDFVNTPGVGVSALVDGRRVSVGRSSQWDGTGFTVVEATVDDRVVSHLWVSDSVKPNASAIVAELHTLDVRPMIVSGDAPGAVRHVAAMVGIDETKIRSAVLPTDKLSIVHELQATGATVAMVGDGVNDAAALVAADLGVAMGTGTDAAMEAGDLTIIDGDLAKVPRALALSRRTLGIIRANLFWAFAYNVAALPLAVAGLMNPVIAGLAMALSSVFVVTNSLRLRR
ncbi:MAG: cadmium-translocating P-type ATPase [Actinobacteria bacterium]|nr:cadmium-translocating P-type ATPase [Actinomycetota bacterium]